jgi:hypothetical protein
MTVVAFAITFLCGIWIGMILSGPGDDKDKVKFFMHRLEEDRKMIRHLKRIIRGSGDSWKLGRKKP